VRPARVRISALVVETRFEPCRQVVRAGNHLTIAIDGTYVRSDLTNGLYQHYVVAGRVERDGELGGHFAWVAQRPDDALEFMRAAMRSDGWTERSRVAVLADGADGLADLVSAVSPNTCRSILDWFHISLRLGYGDTARRGHSTGHGRARSRKAADPLCR
jgi:hypothetical protein